MGNKAFFQLRDRLARQKVTHPDDAFNAQAQDDEVDELHLRDKELDPACEGKDEDGKRRIRARFGRRRSILDIPSRRPKISLRINHLLTQQDNPPSGPKTDVTLVAEKPKSGKL
jgi:hypothetical protein